jgi:4-hydroxy-3-methylbut-2-en-1-yl diphosphate reductase
MKIIRAEHLGMCFGVRDAIALAVKESAAAPLTILGGLVHNETVLAGLRAGGIKIEHEIANVSTPSVMITAHGTSQRALNAVKRTGLNVLEATCPLVRVAHEAIMGLAAQGYHPVVIGQREHVEVRGLTGDLDAFDVVLREADVLALPERARFGVAAQTTQPIARVEELVGLIRRRFPNSEVRFIDTVCRPTKQRQTAAVELARRCDVVVVIGGAHSNNTRELAATCRLHCDRVHQVSEAAGLRPEWFAGARIVGITAGTSTPDSAIDEVQARLENWSNDYERPETLGDGCAIRNGDGLGGIGGRVLSAHAVRPD